jgi:Glucodextranase, domain B
MLLCAQSAAAAITSSSIDSPASPYRFFADQSSSVAFTVHGTASGTGSVDLNCYAYNSTRTVVGSVPVTNGEFTAQVTNSQAYSGIGAPCVLRAVPQGDSTARPPSATGDPFQGPTLTDALAYLPNSASGTTPGWLPLQYTKSLDPSTGAITFTSHEPAVKCADQSCTSYTAAGVELDRTIQMNQDGHVIVLTDSWRSTDGASHALDATYVQGVHTGADHASFLFPGSSGFQDYPLNASISLPHGPGTIYIKEDQATPDTGDATHPQGAVTYASAPDSAAVFTYSDETGGTSYAEWDAHYVRTVPATGALVLRFSYAQQYALADVKALAQAAVNSFAPSLAITSPADGSSTTNPHATISGTATDSAGITSLTVNGQAVNVAGNGSWSAPVVLAAGANQITAVATDADGFTTTRQLTVTYTPPAPAPGPGSQPSQPSQISTLTLRGKPAAIARGVRVRLLCNGASCVGSARLTVSELVRSSDGRVVSLQGRRRPGTFRRTVTVGQIAFTLRAGQTALLTIRLNAQGRKLLAQFGRLSVNLSIASGQRVTIATARLTINAPKQH